MSLGHWFRFFSFLGLTLVVYVSIDYEALTPQTIGLIASGLVGMLVLHIAEWTVMEVTRLKLLKQLEQREEENGDLRESLLYAAEDFMGVAGCMWDLRMGKETEIEHRQDWVRSQAASAFLRCLKHLSPMAVQTALTSLDGHSFKDPNPMRDVLEMEIRYIVENGASWRDELMRFLHNGDFPREEPPPLPLPRTEPT